MDRNNLSQLAQIPNAEKLIESYRLSIAFSEQFESEHWRERNELKRAKFFSFLEEDINKLANFRTDKFLSKGLDDAVDIQNIPSAFIKLVELHGGERCLEFFQEKNVGSSDKSINIFSKFIDYHEIFLVDYVIRLEDNFFVKNSNPVICEIGGGYGALARMIISNHACKYILIDLPETNLLSTYYLSEHFPENKKRILHFSDLNKSSMNYKDIEDFDIIIIPPNITFDSSIGIDLFINTRSFMEMSNAIIQEYFNLIHANIKEDGSFFNVNRYHKNTSHEDLMIARYPYDKKWSVTLSEKAFLQDWIHLLFTKRTSLDNKDFQLELSRLERESKNHIHAKSRRYLSRFIAMLSRYIPSSFKQTIRKVIATNIPE
jgi:putative sugar O-methyltransferase